jgi:hypothetical protein
LRRVPPPDTFPRNDFAFTLQQISVLALLSALAMTAFGCASGGMSQTTANSQPASQIQVAVSPSNTTVLPSAQQKFTATVIGTSNSAVTWSASAGSIASDGTFTAPAAKTGTQITITAKSVTGSAQATSQVTIAQASKLAVGASTLSPALVNTPYNSGLGASGGRPPYVWTISAGSLPAGIQLQSTSGALAGTPGHLGTFSFTAKVTDSASNTATQAFTLTVSPNTSAAYDGPAELPRVYLQTTMADTPAPGSVIMVNSGGDLQSALNSAACGDTIELQAGATFSARQYVFPAKSCDDQHWIIVRTSASDASLPPEGTRLTPCYAGVSSLPGRPAFTCSSTQKVVATLSASGTGDGPVALANGANHYRLLGLEITRVANNGEAVGALISALASGSMQDIVLDRLYIHGSPLDETRRGVAMSGGIDISVQDSYLSDFHCNEGGTCTDSQAVSGGMGNLPMGPFKIVDNFLEAAGENILLGGDQATYTPADIQISRNHLFKPMIWMKGQPGFIGVTPVVKNLFELKNAQRVLVDSNIMENAWGGFSQHGAAILITPKNQDIAGASVCPLCQVTDVTIRYGTISHIAEGFVISDGKTQAGGTALAGERYSIHDIILDDIDGTAYLGYGTFAEVGSVAQPLLQNVQINHMTAFPNHAMLNVGADTPVQITGFVFTNSIVLAGVAPVWSTGGGSINCAHTDVPIKTVNACFSSPIFAYNAILESPYPATSWPGGNFFYSTAAMDFVNYNNGNGGDYHLLPSSPAIGAANDGTNLGANVDLVYSDIAGVQ